MNDIKLRMTEDFETRKEMVKCELQELLKKYNTLERKVNPKNWGTVWHYKQTIKRLSVALNVLDGISNMKELIRWRMKQIYYKKY